MPSSPDGYGTPWIPYGSSNEIDSGGLSGPGPSLSFSIHLPNSTRLVHGIVALRALHAEFPFDLSLLPPRTAPYDLVFSGRIGIPNHGLTDKTYNTTSSILVLPNNISGSATRVDNLHGGLQFRGPGNASWEPLLPHGYYGSYNRSNSSAASDKFVNNYTSNGTDLNAIIALADFADDNPVYDSMDKIGLRFMYDLRGSYMNLSLVEQHVNAVRHHPKLFGYWTADEPDGWQHPFDAQVKAYDLIRQLDPYHPVEVTLNCQNYYFDKYSLGADIIMEDVYPIGIHTFSKWNTICNSTLGDCGCDNCLGNVRDVSARLRNLTAYEQFLGIWPLPKFHNPQVFHGEGYWDRDPTTAEAWVMNASALNAGATGILGWTWPGSQELFDVHTEMAKLVTSRPVQDFLLSDKSIHGPGPNNTDASMWLGNDTMLISIVNEGYDDITGQYTIDLPFPSHRIESVIWGGLNWNYTIQKGIGYLSVPTLPAMSLHLVVMNITGEL